jgi:hypothetical protein
MSENSGIANILRGKKTKAKKETFPNDLYLKAMKSVADELVGKMFYYNDQPVLITEVCVGVPNIYGEPTSGIEVKFIKNEKFEADIFNSWDSFRAQFRTREEYEEFLNRPEAPDPTTVAEFAADLDKNIKDIRMTLAMERLKITAEQFNITKTALLVTHPSKNKRTKKFQSVASKNVKKK